jgi:hypothetical protein
MDHAPAVAHLTFLGLGLRGRFLTPENCRTEAAGGFGHARRGLCGGFTALAADIPIMILSNEMF